MITPYPERKRRRTRVAAFFVLLVVCLAPAQVFSAPDRGVAIRIRTFPPEAELYWNGDVLRPDSRDGAWREYRLSEDQRVLTLSAPGYRERPIHVLQVSGTVEMEERLTPKDGPLVPAGEFPTGAAPKSVAFLPGNRLVVPLLRDNGVDLFRWIRGDGAIDVVLLDTLKPPGNPSDSEVVAFVEPLFLPERRELWVTRMDPDEVHRFDPGSRRWLGSIPSGGRWPKVMVHNAHSQEVFVANWHSETVTVIDPSSGAVKHTIPVGGQPRGMWLSPEGGLLWVCIFSTGDIELIDTISHEVVHRLDMPPGAARHIVGCPDGTAVYYSDMLHGTVSRIDAERRVVTHTRRVGPNVNTIAVDPRGQFVFAGVRGRNNRDSYLLPGPEHGRLVVLDADTLAPVQTLWGRRQPTGVAVSPDGTLLAATDFLDDNLALYEIRR